MPGHGGAGDIAIAYCPERVLPGRILVELIDNDRCIGGITPLCARKALAFYRQFVRGACITTAFAQPLDLCHSDLICKKL